jgi:uncharacterized protein YbbC (DUF1343 family)
MKSFILLEETQINMKQIKLILISTFLLGISSFCKSGSGGNDRDEVDFTPAPILVGAERHEVYLPELEGKRVALAVNQTSVLSSRDNLHLVDFLLEQGVDIKKVFVPEHGFRGDADAGEKVENQIDPKTNLPLVSLYGDSRKPSASSLEDVDVVIFDIQDVGVRFYTYISTLHYLMESCAENNKPLMVLDRPNPNGDYVDGPVLKEGFTSFVGMHPIPVVHGVTVAELAEMINGEGWLKGKVKVDLKIVKTENWNHDLHYPLPIKPSPNLPNDVAIRLYPSLCFFEGTDVSLGRGTKFPFQVYGYPDPGFGDFAFTPVSIEGMSKNPPHQDKKCYGVDLRKAPLSHQFTLEYLLDAYHKLNKGEKFFNNFFDRLAGSDLLRKDIMAGKSEAQIRESWKADLDRYMAIREKYLMYP